MANPTSRQIAGFRDRCPALRALEIALVTVPEFEHAFLEGGTSMRAGRNDSMMAWLLPYCDAFVTRDGRQRESLSQVKQLAQLGTEVLEFGQLAARLRA